MTITADDREELEEERRLCYVGITRAEEKLTLTCARRRMIRGETQYNRIARFVGEIPVEILDTGSRRAEEGESFPTQDTYRSARAAFQARPFAADYSQGRSGSSGRQPFSSLQKGSQLAAGTGGGLSYGPGDRVRHEIGRAHV